jgi:monofunctional glycosyltransferase
LGDDSLPDPLPAEPTKSAEVPAAVRPSRRMVKLVRALAYVVGIVLLLPVLLVIDSYRIVLDVRPLARKAPDRTPVMEARLRDARTPRPLRHRFVPLDAISPHLVHAVIVHEDATFFQHGGYDSFEIRAALEKSWQERRLIRGASTLTNQLARNLYLGNDRTPLRKLREIPLTFRLEKALDKRRILELYLNFAEWGPGVFGAEAASRYHFGLAASQLSPAQAALMAAALPSPRRSTPAHPSPYLRRRAAIILARMQARGWLTPEGQSIGRAALGLRGAPAESPETPLGNEPEPAPVVNPDSGRAAGGPPAEVSEPESSQPAPEENAAPGPAIEESLPADSAAAPTPSEPTPPPSDGAPGPEPGGPNPDGP